MRGCVNDDVMCVETVLIRNESGVSTDLYMVAVKSASDVALVDGIACARSLMVSLHKPSLDASVVSG